MAALTVGSLFSGIGGIELGLEMASPDFHTVFQVERDPYALAVLRKHWPDALRVEGVHHVNRTTVPRIDLLCGGFPCQPHSVAGKRGGADDERDLWPEFARIIGETRPRWVVAENVPGLLSNDAGRFFGGVLRDLARLGFDAEWHRFPASAVGARHERQRVWIVAYPNRERRDGGGAFPEQAGQPESQNRRANVVHANRERLSGRIHERGCEAQHAHASHGGASLAHAQSLRYGSGSVPLGDEAAQPVSACDCSQPGHVAHALRSGREEQHAPAEPGSAGQHSWRGDAPDWAGGKWEQPSPTTFSAVRGMADGFPGRVGRLKCLGNAVVPQAAAVIGRAIREAEAWREMTGELPLQIVLPRHLRSA